MEGNLQSNKSIPTDKDLGLHLSTIFTEVRLKKYLEVRIEFEESKKIFSVANIWRTADWHEREAYDLMGVLFEGHPDMKRILLPHDWEGHPLKKDYEVADYYHGMYIPKDKTSWE